MEELIYLCVRIACIGYLLFRVYGWKKRIGAKTPRDKRKAAKSYSV